MKVNAWGESSVLCISSVLKPVMANDSIVSIVSLVRSAASGIPHFSVTLNIRIS